MLQVGSLVHTDRRLTECDLRLSSDSSMLQPRNPSPFTHSLIRKPKNNGNATPLSSTGAVFPEDAVSTWEHVTFQHVHITITACWFFCQEKRIFRAHHTFALWVSRPMSIVFPVLVPRTVIPRLTAILSYNPLHVSYGFVTYGRRIKVGISYRTRIQCMYKCLICQLLLSNWTCHISWTRTAV